MKILLVAEGVHELSGALEALVRRVTGKGAEMAVETARISDASVRVNTQPGKGGALKKRIVRWALEAEKRGCDALVLVVDEDGDRERRVQVREANETTGVGAARAAGVAIRTFDAWMVADEGAMARILGMGVDRQKAPEEMRDPKGVFVEHHERSGVAASRREAYAGIAATMDLGLLEERCPEGFGEFAGRLRKIFD